MSSGHEHTTCTGIFRSGTKRTEARGGIGVLVDEAKEGMREGLEVGGPHPWGLLRVTRGHLGRPMKASARIIVLGWAAWVV